MNSSFRWKWIARYRVAVLCAGMCAWWLTLVGGSVAADELHPLAPADTSSPRSTLDSFRSAGHETYHELVEQHGRRGTTRGEADYSTKRLLDCLDSSKIPEYLRTATAKRATVCLLEVLDRIELPESDEIPGPDEVESSGGDGPSRWRIPNTEIVITRVTEGPRQGEYLFSPDTVARAPEFYERVKHLPYKPAALEGFYEWFLSEPGAAWLSRIVHSLPAWARSRVSGQAIWQWVGLAITVAVGLLLMITAFVVGRRWAKRLRETSPLRNLLTLLFPLAALAVPILLRNFVSETLVITGMTLAVVEFATNIVFLLAVLVVVVSLGNRISEAIIAWPRIHPRGIDAQFIRIISRVTSLAVAVIVFLEGGRYLGIPLSTLLAGAGVGGLAVALAAQDTLRNFFGSLMILLDKPFRVGERIVAKGYDGVVQEIGLRSTRLRLLTGHEATIPNDELARCDIENIGRRPHIRRITDIALPLNLSPERSAQAVSIVREILTDHEGMEQDFPPRVYLNDFNRDSLNLRMIYWYHPPTYWEFLAFNEQVNLRIKREFAAADIPFALPSTTTFMAQDRARPLEVKIESAAEDDK